LLARPREAEQAFQAAIKKDRAGLGRAKDALTKAWIHRSLGQTRYAMGDRDAAFNHFSMARALAPDQKTRYRVGQVVLWSPQKGAFVSTALDLRPESEELQAVTD
jgi:tetratricopeptide (TPR) repeat protein